MWAYCWFCPYCLSEVAVSLRMYTWRYNPYSISMVYFRNIRCRYCNKRRRYSHVVYYFDSCYSTIQDSQCTVTFDRNNTNKSRSRRMVPWQAHASYQRATIELEMSFFPYKRCWFLTPSSTLSSPNINSQYNFNMASSKRQAASSP